MKFLNSSVINEGLFEIEEWAISKFPWNNPFFLSLDYGSLSSSKIPTTVRQNLFYWLKSLFSVSYEKE